VILVDVICIQCMRNMADLCSFIDILLMEKIFHGI